MAWSLLDVCHVDFHIPGTGIFQISKPVRKGSNGSFQGLSVPGFDICTLWLPLFCHYWARSLRFYDTFDGSIIGLMDSPSCSMCWIHLRRFLGRFLTAGRLSCHAKRMDTSFKSTSNQNPLYLVAEKKTKKLSRKLLTLCLHAAPGLIFSLSILIWENHM